MSALAAVWRPDGGPAAEDCGRVLAGQAIYGPHHGASWDGGLVALGRRLFRTLPEDRHDTGPVALPDGGRLVADVRLDNRDDLIATLDLDPARARATADAGLVAAAWMRWRESCFARLIGDFAVVVWDAPRRRLVLARDPCGHRPLFWHRARGLTAVASMPAGLHALPEIPRAPDTAGLAAFLALGSDAESPGFFLGLTRVPPGGWTVLDSDGARATPADRAAPPLLRLKARKDYAEALREQLDRAVAVRLRGADRAVGAHLSSGWDSAAVAATAARLLAPAGGRVTGFTAAPRRGFPVAAPAGRHGDESGGAAAVAALFDNLDHVVVRGDGRSPLSDLDRDIALAGRPSLNPCNHLWFNDLNRAARDRGVSVMLTGDFGNLTLTDDGVDRLPDLWARGDVAGWLELARATTRAGLLSWAGVLALSLEPLFGPERVNRLRRLAGRDLSAERAHSALPANAWSKGGPGVAGPPQNRATRRLASLTRVDLSGWTKAALATSGVDIRDPLTDLRLVDFCLSVPVSQLHADGRPRALARLALSDRLPVEVLGGRSRGYQAADWHEGLSRDQAAVTADLDRLSAIPAAAGLLDLTRLRRLAERWPTSGWADETTRTDYRMALLRGLSAGRFLTRTLGANG